MPDRFELDEERFRSLLREVESKIVEGLSAAERAEIVMDLELFVVAFYSNPDLHEASEAEQLAWFTYTLAQRSECRPGPPDFAAKGVLGHAASGPVAENCLTLQVCVDGSIPVLVGPIEPDEILGDEPWLTQEQADNGLVRAARELLERANAVIPAARAVAHA